MIERQSWQIKGIDILTELVAMMDVSPSEAHILKNLHEAAQAQTEALTAAFYQRLRGYATTAEYLEGVSVERLNSMLGSWFQDLFSGIYDPTYAQQRLHIGKVHVQIGLPVRYPLAMLDVILAFGSLVCASSADPFSAIQAFHKVLSLDVALFNQAYEDNQLAHLTDLVGGERLARVLLVGQ